MNIGGVELEQIIQIALIALAVLAALIIFWSIMCLITRFYSCKNRKSVHKSNPKLLNDFEQKAVLIKEQREQFNEYVDEFGFSQEIHCSSTVVSNVERDSVKYVLKHSNIDKHIADVKMLDFMREYIDACESLPREAKDIKRAIVRWLPLPLKIFGFQKKLPYRLAGIGYKELDIELPRMQFIYTSPAGQTTREYTAEISSGLLHAIIAEVSGKITKKGHARSERSAMTNDLREAIKLRDNYTCQECGNSVYREPNLLLEVDHIVPISKGGKTEADNLQTLCWRCNRAKSDHEKGPDY